MRSSLDKWLHLGAGLVIGLLAGLVTPWAALPAAVMAGACKELFDSFYPDTHTADPLDFLATALGGVLAWGLVCEYQGLI